jgi:hypothetical protein
MDDHDDTDQDDEGTPSRRVPTVRGHKHECANDCGVSLHCPDDDRCRVKDTTRAPWQCPSCLDHIEELEMNAMAEHYEKEQHARRSR